MKILSAAQIRKADAYTIANEPIASIDLMERAARACYYWFNENIDRDLQIAVFCGLGNNGGDGLALSRMLLQAGYSVQVFVLNHSRNSSIDFETNKKRLTDLGISVNYIKSVKYLQVIQADVWIDALLGSGLNASLKGLLAETVTAINGKRGQKIAIDMPTGLFADKNDGNELANIFKADYTLTFQAPKRSFVFPIFGTTAGKVVVLPIGLDEIFLAAQHTNAFYVTETMVADMVPKRGKFDHKGTFGHAMLIAGSKGKIGAALLASRAALRSGAGLATAYVPKCGVVPMQAALPEVMVLQDEGENCIADIQFSMVPNAIGIGPGLGTAQKTEMVVLNFLSDQTLPLVIDADALNILSKANGWTNVPKYSILTPHLGELQRMLGITVSGENVEEPTAAFAVKHQLYVLLKGAHSALFIPDGQVFFNSTGTNAMATAGSGDVLTGIITGLLAQGISPKNAALMGMYFHGKAGESAANKIGERAVMAGDIIENLNIA